VVGVHEAIAGSAYSCRGCGAPVLFIPKRLNQAHFRHKVRDNTPEGRCDYSEESYGHKQAKIILSRLGWVQVPAVYPRRLEGYLGPVTQLRPGYPVNGYEVLPEKRLFEGPDCALLMEKIKGQIVEEPGKMDFICQPDILFTDAKGQLLLLIEIHVTHRTKEEKIAGIRRAQVDAIEISIPWYYSPAEIEQLIIGAQHTKWLYNNERELAPAVGADSSAGTTARPGVAYQIPAPEPEPGESVECQIHEIKEAVRSLAKCLDLPDVGAAIAAIEDAQSELRGAAADMAREYQREFERAERDYLAKLGGQQRLLDREQERVDAAHRERRAEAQRRVGERLDPAARITADATAAVREQQSRLDGIRAGLEERYRQRRVGLQGEIDRMDAEARELAHLQLFADGLDREEGVLREAAAELERESAALAAEEAKLAEQEAAAEQQRIARAQHLAESTSAAGILRNGFERAEAAMVAELATVETGLARARNTNDSLRRLKKGAIAARFGG
jgi:hypothetical protein